KELFAMKPGLQFPHAIQIYNSRPVNTHELFRVELRLNGVHGGSEQMGFPAYMESHIVARCFQPVDINRSNQNDPPSGFDNQAAQKLTVVSYRFEQRPKCVLGQLVPLAKIISSSIQRFLKAFLIEGLQ